MEVSSIAPYMELWVTIFQNFRLEIYFEHVKEICDVY